MTAQVGGAYNHEQSHGTVPELTVKVLGSCRHIPMAAMFLIKGRLFILLQKVATSSLNITLISTAILNIYMTVLLSLVTLGIFSNL